ncbi:hypothetical protein BJV82DRAFT_582474 [Fennellomyces sp. T-0311]|nr:hypothetical protein BJV82DRAFT_584084 [Fennellomyces sp. T-0311]KAI8138822.1 hypothetical protein BJV82DRAFT_582474 [Fennellomyces sp. T-0311]
MSPVALVKVVHVHSLFVAEFFHHHVPARHAGIPDPHAVVASQFSGAPVLQGYSLCMLAGVQHYSHDAAQLETDAPQLGHDALQKLEPDALQLVRDVPHQLILA